MSNKKQQTYQHVFQFINANLLQLRPQTIMTDFERALRNSLAKVFPGVRLKGCWFHFCQAVRRKLSKMSDLAKQVKTTPEAKRIFQKLLVLPLLPPCEIENGFNICKHEAYSNIKLSSKLGNIFEKFFDYFQRQWIEVVCILNKNSYLKILKKLFYSL